MNAPAEAASLKGELPPLSRHGALWQAGEGTTFRLWAPSQEAIDLLIEGEPPRRMTALADGWHALTVPEAGPGTLYRFGLVDGIAVPDPASRFQPQDVRGPSEVIDAAAYAWRDAGWRGRPWHETVLYELHVGTFTPEGTFRAAIDRLDHLVALGVTAVEIMPVADFPGRRNWGYDGVLLYAPDSSYGRPEDFKAFVDAAHARGLSVILDVVYNHFGPDGNYLSLYATPFFTDRHRTPWGPAVNYDGSASRPVRDFVIGNALAWVADYHVDGFRLDAVHAIVDDSAVHLLEELALQLRAAAGDRPLHLILENEENEVRLLDPTEPRAPGRFTAQWNDDVHHVLHVAATGESEGYYGDYTGETSLMAAALAEGFGFQGQVMPYRGRTRGEPSASLPPQAFVAFLQNHDQIGNRAFGDRLPALTTPAALRAVTAVLLLLPQIPMLFMGEEWASRRPFLFFCDFAGDLARAVRDGRRQEFARFAAFQDPHRRKTIPDPVAEATFLASKLDWAEARSPEGQAHLDLVRRLIALRRAEIVPRLAGMAGHSGRAAILGDAAISVDWRLGDGSRLRLDANLKDRPQPGVPAPTGRLLWQEGDAGEPDRLGPWALRWTLTTSEA